MKLALFSLTPKGKVLAEKLSSALPDCRCLHKGDYAGTMQQQVAEQFATAQGLVFFCATGIVVRMIAPYLQSKATDPAVVVVDESGKFAISLLSGHLGGANNLAQIVGEVLDAQPVITTATDSAGMISFDVFAKEQGLVIENLPELRYISGALLAGEQVAVFSEIAYRFPPNCALEDATLPHAVVISSGTTVPTPAEHVLWLRPKNLVLGVGCRRGTEPEALQTAVEDFLQKHGRSPRSLAAVASINLKEKEPAILALCQQYQLPFYTLTPEQMQPFEADFAGSDFVRKTTGVGNVCEIAAVHGVGKATLVCPKEKYTGITLALAQLSHPILKQKEEKQ